MHAHIDLHKATGTTYFLCFPFVSLKLRLLPGNNLVSSLPHYFIYFHASPLSYTTPHGVKRYCKGVGSYDWSHSSGNISFQSGNNGDQPFIANIVGDGPRACNYRPSTGILYVKSRGSLDWSSQMGNFGLSANVQISMGFPGSKGVSTKVCSQVDPSFYFCFISFTAPLLTTVVCGLLVLFLMLWSSSGHLFYRDPDKYRIYGAGGHFPTGIPWHRGDVLL